MNVTKRVERQADRMAEVPSMVTDAVAPFVRDALRDRRVRDALNDAYGTGRRLFDEVRGSDAKHAIGRMARDESLQRELAAVVRSATRAVDEGIASGRRRMRKRLLWAGTIGGILVVAGARVGSRRATTDDGTGVPHHPDSVPEQPLSAHHPR